MQQKKACLSKKLTSDKNHSLIRLKLIKLVLLILFYGRPKKIRRVSSQNRC